MSGVLVVAAHPDDELLGVGGTIARHVVSGDSVRVLVVGEGATSRVDGAPYKAEALKEAAKNAAKPGNEGPLIIISMKATSMPELISCWAGYVADPRKSFDALQAVVYQKLVRKLCENCRVAYKPSQDLAKQGLPIDTVEQLYRKGGQVELKNKIVTCPICNGSGYMGQVGVFETMFLDSDTRKHLIAGDLKAAMSHAKRNKRYIRLQEAAWYKVAAGETSLEEFGRVSKKKAAKKKMTRTK